jgi:hypothetical protein
MQFHINPAAELEIPEPHVDLEKMPFPEPDVNATDEYKDILNQLPPEIKENGFGFYFEGCDNIMELSDEEFYNSYLGNYAFCYGESFLQCVERIRSKVGGVRPGADVESILAANINKLLSNVNALQQLYTRQQLIYNGW